MLTGEAGNLRQMSQAGRSGQSRAGRQHREAIVPKYIFHFPSSPDLHPIEEHLDGPDEVLAEAATVAGQLMKDQAVDFWRSPDRRLYVTDEQGTVVCTVRFVGTTGEP
jgi:hypothetical protein